MNAKRKADAEKALLRRAMSLLAKRPRKWTEARQKAVEKAARAPRKKKNRTEEKTVI